MTVTVQLGSADNPLRVAIVGSGPSGFYAAEEMLQGPVAAEVTMIERLPVPFGLVRSGVAPDHPKLKQPMAVFDRIAQSPAFRYFGNVRLGVDVTLAELEPMFHAVILACGSQSERRLGIPGEDVAGSHAGTDFVGWYNGHPDHAGHRFDLTQESVVIVGQGNVALDIARMLAKSVDELRHTDIAQHALDALADSRVRDIHIVGRRGPAQVKFTPSELIELGKIPGCDVVIDDAELALNEASAVEAADKMSRNIASNLVIFHRF
ncbi:MAG TPA: FAD-dependent oxidoreductase, partial [Burkholderiales bacterium]